MPKASLIVCTEVSPFFTQNPRMPGSIPSRHCGIYLFNRCLSGRSAASAPYCCCATLPAKYHACNAATNMNATLQSPSGARQRSLTAERQLRLPLAGCIAISLLLASVPLLAAVGPFDYRTERHYIEKVEVRHFTPAVENLAHGSTGSVWSDLNYTLSAYPNHPRALRAMTKLLRLYRSGKKFTDKRTYDLFHGMDVQHSDPEFYLQRAVDFAPDDPAVRLLYAIHLHKLGRLDAALKRYKEAQRLQPDNPEVHYDLGLLYFDMKKYSEARRQAKKAYDMGYPLPGLRNKLNAVGQ